MASQISAAREGLGLDPGTVCTDDCHHTGTGCMYSVMFAVWVRVGGDGDGGVDCVDCVGPIRTRQLCVGCRSVQM